MITANTLSNTTKTFSLSISILYLSENLLFFTSSTSSLILFEIAFLQWIYTNTHTLALYHPCVMQGKEIEQVVYWGVRQTILLLFWMNVLLLFFIIHIKARTCKKFFLHNFFSFNFFLSFLKRDTIPIVCDRILFW